MSGERWPFPINLRVKSRAGPSRSSNSTQTSLAGAERSALVMVMDGNLFGVVLSSRAGKSGVINSLMVELFNHLHLTQIGMYRAYKLEINLAQL